MKEKGKKKHFPINFPSENGAVIERDVYYYEMSLTVVNAAEKHILYFGFIV